MAGTFKIYNPSTAVLPVLTLREPLAGDTLRDEAGAIIAKTRLGYVLSKTITDRPDYTIHVYDFNMPATPDEENTASPGPAIEVVKSLLAAAAGIKLKFVYTKDTGTETFYGFIVNPDIEITNTRDDLRYLLHLEVLDDNT